VLLYAAAMSQLAVRSFGRTDLSVSALGLGAGEIGATTLDEIEVEALLRTAIDCGITLIDTACSYGLSEDRIGRYLAPVRDAAVLSTKVGYGVDGVADWTGECVRRGLLTMSYSDLITELVQQLNALVEFLREPFNRTSAASAIRPDLHRQKASPAELNGTV